MANYVLRMNTKTLDAWKEMRERKALCVSVCVRSSQGVCVVWDVCRPLVPLHIFVGWPWRHKRKLQKKKTPDDAGFYKKTRQENVKKVVACLPMQRKQVCVLNWRSRNVENGYHMFVCGLGKKAMHINDCVVGRPLASCWAIKS